jgi:hypothetical protein
MIVFVKVRSMGCFFPLWAVSWFDVWMDGAEWLRREMRSDGWAG